MGKKCSVTNCCAGYNSVKNNLISEVDNIKNTVSSFPIKNNNLLQKWLNPIPRTNLKSTKNSGVCELHFKADDIMRKTKDTNKNRKEKKNNNLSGVRLREDAVPSVFPNCSSYLTKNLPPRRSGATTSKERLKKADQITKEQVNLENERDKLCSLPDLLDKLNRKLLPESLMEKTVGTGYRFFTAGFNTKPDIFHCIYLTYDLQFRVFHKDTELSIGKFKDITKGQNRI